jgi:two-component system sensor histidine kinase MprB
VPLIGRASALERAVLNILDNATKWTPADQPVVVRLHRGPIGGSDHTGREQTGREHARLDVEDAGPGVPAEDRPRIFERFYRAADARAMPGSGLGLAIVHQAVLAHGGTVGVGTGPRGGALFTVLLPCSAPAPAVG